MARNELFDSSGNVVSSIDVPDEVPSSISPRQARLALHGAGLLDAVESMVQVADRTVQIYYESSVDWRRDDPILIGMANQLGMTADQLDDLFRQASQL